MIVKAIHLGKKINLKEAQLKLGQIPTLRDPILYEVGDGKFVVLLRYGVCVFWNMNNGEINEFISKIDYFIIEKFETHNIEEAEVINGEKDEISSDKIRIHNLEIHKVALISVVLGRSVALDHYEQEVDKVMQQFDSVIKSFVSTGKTSQSSKSLVKKIGFAMSVRHLTVTQMAFLDKPDLTWDDANLDKFYNNLAEYYELDDRYEVLDDKLETVFRNSEFISDYIASRRTFAAEVIIILLIAFELLIFFLEKLP